MASDSESILAFQAAFRDLGAVLNSLAIIVVAIIECKYSAKYRMASSRLVRTCLQAIRWTDHSHGRVENLREVTIEFPNLEGVGLCCGNVRGQSVRRNDLGVGL